MMEAGRRAKKSKSISISSLPTDKVRISGAGTSYNSQGQQAYSRSPIWRFRYWHDPVSMVI